MIPRTGNGTTRNRGLDLTITRYGTTPCGYEMRNGEVCQKPRVIGLSNKESKACVDHGEAVKEILRRKYAAKRREKKARGR